LADRTVLNVQQKHTKIDETGSFFKILLNKVPSCFLWLFVLPQFEYIVPNIEVQKLVAVLAGCTHVCKMNSVVEVLSNKLKFLQHALFYSMYHYSQSVLLSTYGVQ
jgi:hypothetical protein